MAGKKRKRPKNGMLITNIRTKTSVILWSFLAIFAVGGVFGMFGMDIIGSRLGLNKPQQKLQNAKVKIPKIIVKVDDTALGDELFNDLYIRMLEMSDIRDVGRNYFYRVFLKSQALDSMIRQQIFLEEAKKRKIRVTSGEVNKALRTYRDYILGKSSRLEDPGLPARVKFFFDEKESDKAMQEILMRRGVSGKTFKQAMRRDATLRNVQKQLIDEAKAKEEADAKKRAQDVLTKVKAGEAFFTLAREFSEDLSTRENGGDRGWFNRGTWETEFENAAFSMAPGQTSDLVKSDSGFHIIRVEGKKVAVGPDFEREKPALLEKLTRELGREPTDAEIQNAFEEVKARHILIKTKSDEAILSDWYGNERKKHKVEIINPELKAFRYNMGLDISEGEEKDDKKALALYDDALEADPTNEYLHYMKGYLYEDMHSKAKNEEEKNPYAQFETSTAAATATEKPGKKDKTDYMQKALEEYREAYAIAKEKEVYVTDPMLYLGVARAYEELGQKKQARVYLADAVDFAAGNKGHLAQIEESLVRLGGAKKALAEVRELIAELEPPEQQGLQTFTVGEGDEEETAGPEPEAEGEEEKAAEEPAPAKSDEEALEEMEDAIMKIEEMETETGKEPEEQPVQ